MKVKPVVGILKIIIREITHVYKFGTTPNDFENPKFTPLLVNTLEAPAQVA